MEEDAIQPRGVLADLRAESLRSFDRAGVGRKDDGLRKLAPNSRQRLGMAAGDEDFRPVGTEELRGREADASGAAGDEVDFVIHTRG